MGTQLKPDLSNLEDLADATPHYYGDNFPNSELSSFDYSRHVLDLGGSVIYELWALPSWATVPTTVRSPGTWSQAHPAGQIPTSTRASSSPIARKAQAATGSAPAIVGIENEVDQPPEVFSCHGARPAPRTRQSGIHRDQNPHGRRQLHVPRHRSRRGAAQESRRVEGHRLRRRARVRLSGVPRRTPTSTTRA